MDLKRGNYYVSGNDPGRMVIVSREGLNVIGAVSLPTPTNLIAYDPATGMAYETSDTTPRIWVIDPASEKVVTTITLRGSGMQELALDPQYKHLFQALKGASTITVIDAANNDLLNVWSLAPDTLPHGVAIVPERDGLLVACAGKLALISRSTGKILDRAEIAPDVDGMAYDPGTHLAYCAQQTGRNLRRACSRRQTDGTRQHSGRKRHAQYCS